MKPEHNGKCGVITFLVEGGRLRVKLDDSTQLDLKPENLTKLLSHDESSESQLQGKHVFRPKVRSLLGTSELNPVLFSTRLFVSIPRPLEFAMQPKTETAEPNRAAGPSSNAKATKNVSMLSFNGGEEGAEGEEDD
jgi:hypothetical protein